VARRRGMGDPRGAKRQNSLSYGIKFGKDASFPGYYPEKAYP
jgi:hypothetical protein